jgi:hypothetical protein
MLLRPPNGVLRPFIEIAWRAKQLDIADVVTASEGKRHHMISVVVLLKPLSTINALSSLFLV